MPLLMLVLLAFFVGAPNPAQAKFACQDYLNSFLFQNTNVIFFNQAEVFRQNNDIGPQQLGKLRFEKWVDFTLDFEHTTFTTANSAIGLTASGKLYHVVTYEGRTVARLLNGTLSFTEFKMLYSGEIIAQDANKKTYIYLPKTWEVSPSKAVIRQGLAYWGLSSAIAVGTKLALVGQTFAITLVEAGGISLSLPVFETMIVATAGMNTALVMANKYYHKISYPNGFIPVEIAYDKNIEVFAEIRKLRAERAELGYTKEHLQPPDFSRLPPALAKELTEDIQD